jgi:hypothetical protein
VPTISRFYGIAVQTYFDDHDPPTPTTNAAYGDDRAVIGIQDLAILEGDLPPKAIGLVMQWASAHRNELLKEWDLAGAKRALLPFKPLE